MNEDVTNDLLAKISEQQCELLKQLQAAQSPKPKKDFWDQMTALAPIMSAVIIACTGAYFTYTYNLQQLKLQEIQTIEKFMPHLAGDERNKRAAILAISSLGNARLAAKVASVFASPGTASALTSIAKTSEPSDEQTVRDALYKTLDAMADKAKDSQPPAFASLSNRKPAEDGSENSDICNSLDQLAALYKQHGDNASAEQVLKRVATLRHHGSTEPATPAEETKIVQSPQSQEAPAVSTRPGSEIIVDEKQHVKPASEIKPVKAAELRKEEESVE